MARTEIFFDFFFFSRGRVLTFIQTAFPHDSEIFLKSLPQSSTCPVHVLTSLKNTAATDFFPIAVFQKIIFNTV